ncbi:MAG: Rieske 2Fe-2S domain-containing protein [Gammaproteobacteria bacterium]|nr:Rieske 2Fe-2S domain-containing protein [Gammaproteobacteria bacterium]MDH5803261.1 Rieske 2Fe-2S domain-containing protein [Gammaproteobacteria bacterium]
MTVNGDETALFIIKRAQRFFAYLNRCPHTGVSLNWQPDQFLDYENEFIQCAMHGALFQVEDGLCIRGPCVGRSLTPVTLTEKDNALYVDPAALASTL